MEQTLFERAALPVADGRQLAALAAAQQAFADLTGADIFIDCADAETGEIYVAAQAAPGFTLSAYEKSVLGKTATPENEPAVHHAFTHGMPVRDLKAVTQENLVVRQDALPIRSEKTGVVIAVLISERDVSRDVSREKKYEQLVRSRTAEAAPAAGDEALREIHHRVKNNLQMVASIMNLQSRRTENEEVRRAFRENTARVLSIAAIHDMLTRGDSAPVALLDLFEKLRRNLQSIFYESCPVEISIEGDALFAGPDRATDIVLVTNELVTNSLKHGFSEGERGEIHIELRAGVRVHTVTVRDNGKGFDPARHKSDSLGLSIVTLTVSEKLGGELRFSSDERGTVAAFDFSV